MPELVLDLTRLLPGPLCTKILHSMGFRVLRLLPPSGDLLERFSPEAFQWLQEGKEVEVLDLKTKSGAERLRTLAVEAAVLVENGLPGKMEALGLGPEVLRALNPKLVYARLGGFRETSGGALPGHDLTYLASAGLIPKLGSGWRTIPVADLAGAFWAALAVLQGLRNGVGFYEIYMEEAALTVAWPRIPYLDGGHCCYTIYPAAEGEVAVAALEPHLWDRFCDALSRPEWKDAALTPASPENPVYCELGELMKSRTAADWELWAAETNTPLRAVRLSPKPTPIAPWNLR